jgi:nitroreductase/NAD-dependent dihydropyrimidine dehydrogenase PreA subunit
MGILSFDTGKCTGCGCCVRECTRDALAVENGKAGMIHEDCLECWHCISVCPTEAISAHDCPGEDIRLCKDLLADLPAGGLLDFIKCRRSVRHYKQIKVDREKIESVIEAGRFTPTGCNRQPFRYMVLDKELEDIKLLCMKKLGEFTLNYPESDVIPNESIRKRFLSMHDDYINSGRDRLFFNAPQVIVIVADQSLGGRPQVDGGMAASNMGLEAFARGLGSCYIGFFVTATEVIPEVRRRLDLKGNEQVITCMTIGYPDVKFYRTVSRRTAKISYL